jgi:ankyrin repeat protein
VSGIFPPRERERFLTSYDVDLEIANIWVLKILVANITLYYVYNWSFGIMSEIFSISGTMPKPKLQLLTFPVELQNLIVSNLTEARSLYALLRTCNHFSVIVAPYIFKFAVQEKTAYALRWAASTNNVTLMQRLLYAGVNVLATEDERYRSFSLEDEGIRYKTALEIALQMGHTHALKMLLDHGGAISNRPHRVLSIAAERGDVPILQMLLEYIPLSLEDNENYPVWRHTVTEAARSGRVEAVGFLLDCGLSLMGAVDAAVREGHAGVLKLLFERDLVEAAKDRYLNTAATDGKADVVEVLLDNGANVNCFSNGGFTPAHYAAQHGHRDTLERLIQRGADITAVSSKGCTPLHVAAKYHQYSTLELLIQKGADLNATDNHGQTALHHAAGAITTCESGYSHLYEDTVGTHGIDIVWLLVVSGAPVDIEDWSGWTPMDVAVWDGWIGMARTLLMARGGIDNFADNLPQLYKKLRRKEGSGW